MSCSSKSKLGDYSLGGGGIFLWPKYKPCNQDYNIRDVLIKDGSQALNTFIDPKRALQALKIKAKISRKTKSKVESFTVPLDATGGVYPAQQTCVNEQVVERGEKPKPLRASQVVLSIWLGVGRGSLILWRHNVRKQSRVEEKIVFLF